MGWTTPEANRGYVAHGREKVTNLTNKEEVEKLKAQVPDLKESIEIVSQYFGRNISLSLLYKSR